jgi:GNAT superfamily N-acetyltransferase
MPAFASRTYNGHRDLNALIAFAQQVTAARSPAPAFYHPGDFIWQLYPFDETEDVRIWSDPRAERDVACAIFEPPLTYEFVVHPDYEDEAGLIAAILQWADSRRAAVSDRSDIPLAYRSRGANTISTSAFASDTRRIQALVRAGYARGDGESWHNERRIDGDLPQIALPSGAEFRTITQHVEEERAALHRDAWSVWGTSAHTVERYRRLRASPLYDPYLDVVLALDGQLASYCICWVDDANKIGLFEPVGTRPAFARMGLARLVLFEAFRRLRERGMRSAIVGTGTVNRPAMALYASAGFTPVEEIHTYLKTDEP